MQTECRDCGSLELYSEIGKLICLLPDSLFGLDDSNCPGFNKSGEWVASAFNESEVESKVEAPQLTLAFCFHLDTLVDLSRIAPQIILQVSDVKHSIG